MGLRKIVFSSILAIASSGLSSCAPEENVCDPIAGTYQPLYTPVSGNCGLINAMRVPLDGGESGVKMHQEMQFGRDILTEVVHKGCTLRVTQHVYQQGVLQSTMNGPELAVHSSKELSGQVSFTRFTATDPQQQACVGTYNATFTRPDGVFDQ